MAAAPQLPLKRQHLVATSAPTSLTLPFLGATLKAASPPPAHLTSPASSASSSAGERTNINQMEENVQDKFLSTLI